MMRQFRSCSTPFAVLVLGFASSGCSESADNLPREAVQGKVTIDGEPLAKGAIRFRTSSPGMATAMEVGGLIHDGEYSISRNQGPVPGTYRVIITEDIEPPPSTGEAPGPRAKLTPSKIPANYNARNPLTAEVKKDQSKSIDFALTSKSDPEPSSRSVRRGSRR
jgi:hypothetical protein